MAEPYQFIDMQASGPGIVAAAFGNQAAYCTANAAPITARVVAALGELLERGEGGAVLDRVRGWTGAPLADALPLRLAGGLHALQLGGTEPALQPVYDGTEGIDVPAILAATLHRYEAALLSWLDGPPQTNEAGRSAGFVAAMLWLAGQGLPSRFQCLEIGSSAGINLMLGLYRYNLGGVTVGPVPGVMDFAPQWRGNPPPDTPITIAQTKGCDVAPVDLTDPAQALRLKAYIWPEHRLRFARMAAAVAQAECNPPEVVRLNAADFVEQQLSLPQEAGTTRVLMHSIVWQYVPEDQQVRVTAAMEAAGARITADRPLAWIALEANRVVHRHELVVRHWPGNGTPQLLARAHAHGADYDWLI